MAEEAELKLLEEKRRKYYSTEEKINFCKKWKITQQKDYWKEIGIAQSTFEKWLKKYGFKNSPLGKFLEVASKVDEEEGFEKKIEIKINLPNKTQLALKMSLSEAIGFVQGLSDAASLVW